ncbi:MAG: hypothetical protein U5K74_16445 [Gemmatimonadaceae bacterium]|nr:hypothetical protein [Gemmatimonadaceae bacterium]
MSTTEWWQRGPVDDVPAMLQPVAHMLLQIHETVHDIVAPLTEAQWNARPVGLAPAVFHVRHITGVLDRLFTYARGEVLSEAQFSALREEDAPIALAEVPPLLQRFDARIDHHRWPS